MKKSAQFFVLILFICSLFFASCNDNSNNDNGENSNLPEEVTVIAEGDCGEKAKWVLKSNGVLTISGNGDMSDYSYGILSGETVKTPWDDNKAQIKKVVVDEGLKSIGDYGGTASDWIEIEIGELNSILLKAERNYNSNGN